MEMNHLFKFEVFETKKEPLGLKYTTNLIFKHLFKKIHLSSILHNNKVLTTTKLICHQYP